MVNNAHATYSELAIVFARPTKSYHARGKEDSRLNIVKCNVAGHLTNRVSDSEDGIDLVELVSSEAQFFSHPGDVGIVQITSIWT